MIFNSVIFVFLFLPLVILLYYIIQDRYRQLFLITASIFFYAYYDVTQAVYFVGFAVITYAFSYIMLRTKHKKLIAKLSVAMLIGYLLLYKYLDFIINNVNAIFGKTIISELKIVAPLGVSFFTFSAIAYILDQYRDNKQYTFLHYWNFISFFPKVISGPIVTIKDFYRHEVEISSISDGLNRFIIGLSKKTILAYYLGLSADAIWENLPFGIDLPSAWIGALSYSLQLYFDFSGYSDMAIGIAKILGYEFRENFSFPYNSKSITEFWRRWHISLGTWFKEYVYVPLGGSKTGNSYVNLLFVFFITGIWHGANWTFIIWGLWHGTFRLLEKFYTSKKLSIRIPSFIRWFMVMLIVVIGWVVFRSKDILEAKDFLSIMFGMKRFPEEEIVFTWRYFLNNRLIFFGLTSLLGATVFEKSSIYRMWNSLEKNNSPVLYFLQTLIICSLLAASVMMILTSKYSPFLYFQF